MNHSCTGIRTLGIIVGTLLTGVAAAAETEVASVDRSELAEAPAPSPAADNAANAKPTEKEAVAPLAKNSIFAEGLGAGLAYSFNYERMVIDDLGVRAGFSYLSASASAGGSSASSTLLTFPITASYVGVRSGKHALELGGGATLAHSSGSASSLGQSASGSGMTAYGTAMVGYRLHPVDHAGFQFRVGAMALLGKGLGLSDPDPEAFSVLPWGYLSMGASF